MTDQSDMYASNERKFSNLNEYDLFRLSLSPNDVKKGNESEILRVLDGVYQQGQTVRLINLASALGYTRINEQGEIFQIPGIFSQAKAALLAQHHFNNRMEDVVTDLDETLTNSDGTKCDLKMTIDLYDTQSSPRHGAFILTEHIHKRPFPYETSAMVGAYRSAVSVPLAIMNNVQRLPQISHGSTSVNLDDRGAYSYFGRVIPPNSGDAEVALQFLTEEMGTTHLGILFVSDEYGDAYRLALERTAIRLGVKTRSEPINFDQSSQEDFRFSMSTALDALAETGFRHFMGILFTQHVEPLIELGSQRGLVGPGRHWMFGDGVGFKTLENLRYPVGSPMAAALQGLTLMAAGASRLNGNYNRFSRAFVEADKDEEFNRYFASKTPLATNEVQFEETFVAGSPSGFSEFVYDAVMAVGIAGCKCDNEFFTADELFAQFLKSSFSGASGTVLIDPSTGSRYYNSTTFVMFNSQLLPPDSDGLVGMETFVALEYTRMVTNEGLVINAWASPEERQLVFSDFSHVPPPALPPLQLRGLRSNAAYAAVTGAACFLVFCSLSFAIWAWMHRQSKVVRASQPEFLYVICLGVVFMALSVILNGSVSPPHSHEWANFSCMGTVWFLGFGFSLVFSALFAKTWRINQLLGRNHQFHHVVVSPKEAAIPFAVLVIGNLLTTAIWEVVDPLKYNLTFDDTGSVDKFGRFVDVSSTCSTKNGNDIYFVGALCSVNVISILAANIQAFKGRRIATEFSESLYIGLAMAIILQAMAISVPVFLFDSDPQSSFIARSTLILAVAASTLFVILVPKVGALRAQEKAAKEKAEQKEERLQRSAYILSHVEERSAMLSTSFGHESGFMTVQNSAVQAGGGTKAANQTNVPNVQTSVDDKSNLPTPALITQQGPYSDHTNTTNTSPQPRTDESRKSCLSVHELSEDPQPFPKDQHQSDGKMMKGDEFGSDYLSGADTVEEGKDHNASDGVALVPRFTEVMPEEIHPTEDGNNCQEKISAEAMPQDEVDRDLR